MKERGCVFIDFEVLSKPNFKSKLLLEGLMDRELRDKVACGVVLRVYPTFLNNVQYKASTCYQMRCAQVQPHISS